MSAATTHEVVAGIVRRAVDAVVDTKAAAIADEPDGVHQHRTAVRRLRSVLAAFEPLLDQPKVRRVRVLYSAWGDDLGVVRDAEVRADVAAELLRENGIQDADAWRRLVDHERSEYGQLHARLVEVAASARSALAESSAEELAADPDVAHGDGSARKRLTKILRREVKRVRRAGDRIDGSIEAHHEARKAARRLRYVAEAIDATAPGLFADLLGDVASAGEGIHDLLGDHRDRLLLIERARRARSLAARAAEAVGPYDELIAHAEKAADALLDAVPRALERVADTGRGI